MRRLTGERLWNDGWAVLWFAVLYAIAQQVALALRLPPANVAMWWPPAGVALAVLLMNPRRRWPALVAVIVTLDLAGNLVDGASLRVAMGFALASSVEALLGTLAVLAVLGRVPRPDDGRDLILMLVLAGGLAPAVGAVISATVLALNDAVASVPATWVNFWAASAAGVVVMAPAVLALGPWRSATRLRAPWEVVAAVATPVVFAALAFNVPSQQISGLHYFLLAAMLWPALRLGIAETAMALVPTALVVSVSTYAGRGPFARNIDIPADAGRVAQMFIVALGGVSLVMSVVPVAQRRALSARTDRLRQQAELRRTEQLHQLSSAMAGATSIEEVAGVIAGRAAAPVRAVAAELAVVLEHDTMVARGLASSTAALPSLERTLGRDGPLEEAIVNDEVVETLEHIDRDADDVVRAVSVPAGYRRVSYPVHDGSGGVVGALAFTWDRVEPAPGEQQLVQVILDLAGQALDRARRTEREHRLAETLQRGLLPASLPDHPQLATAARYLPGTEGLLVGGDWYDMIRLADSRVLIIVGDVAGHGEEAAITMGRLRTVVQADAELPLAELFDRLNRVCVHGGDLATALAIRLDPWEGKAEVVSAGHPPAVLAPPGAVPCLMDVPPNGPLGVGGHASYRTIEIEVPLGSRFVLYTDGLVERRTESIDKGLGRLVDAVALAAIEQLGTDDLADRLVEVLLPMNRADDVALLVCALHPDTAELRVAMPAVPSSVPVIRQHLRHWLGHNGVDDQAQFDILVGAGEAVANAAMHAYPAGRSGMVDLTAARRGDLVELTISDQGRWRPTRQDAGGRGLRILRSIGPVQIVSRADGTTVTLTFDLSSLEAVAP